MYEQFLFLLGKFHCKTEINESEILKILNHLRTQNSQQNKRNKNSNEKKTGLKYFKN